MVLISSDPGGPRDVLPKVMSSFAIFFSTTNKNVPTKAYVEQPWTSTACSLSANPSCCLIIDAEFLKRKPDARLSLAADKEARAKPDKNRQ